MAMNQKLLRPRASGFNPKSIAGLALWLDASDSSTITLNGATVSQWRDKSGNARDLSEATANNQPTMSTMNGKAALSFDGVNDSLSTSSTLMAVGTNSFTLFQALECAFPGGVGAAGRSFEHRITEGGLDDNQITVDWRADQGPAWTFGTLRTRVKSLRTGASYNADQRFDLVNVANPGILTLTGTYAPAAATSTAWWKNTASPTSNGTSDGGSLTGIAIACRNNATKSLFFGGKVAETLCYVGAVTETQRIAVQKYLGSKWGITLA